VTSHTFNTDRQTLMAWLLRALHRIKLASFRTPATRIARVPGSLRRCGQAGVVAGVLALGFVAIPQPAAACSWYDIICWGDAAVDNLTQLGKEYGAYLKATVELSWDIVTLDPKEAWNDFQDAATAVTCSSGVNLVALAFGKGIETGFNDCDIPAHPIDQHTRARLALYFNSDLGTVRVHEKCHFSGRTAITFGEHIYFKDRFRPTTSDGSFETISHELTHVLQYRKKGFATFACEYGLRCGFGYKKDSAHLCQLEDAAYTFEDLVKVDQQNDKDGVFQSIDNCPDRFNPGQEDFDNNKAGNACDKGWTADADKTLELQQLGDFNGDGRPDVLIRSAWGIGLLTHDTGSNTMTSLMLAPSGTWFGAWQYDAAPGRNRVDAIADFNRDGRADILMTSTSQIAILTFDGFSLTPLLVWPKSPVAEVVATADVNGDGRPDIVLAEPWGVRIRAFNGSKLTSVLDLPNQTFFGSAFLGSGFSKSKVTSAVGHSIAFNSSIAGFGDFNADGKEDIVIRTALGLAILTVDNNTVKPLAVAPVGTKVGRWTVKATDRIAAIGHFDDDTAAQMVIVNNSRLAILGRRTYDASQLTDLGMASNGTNLGGWVLDTQMNTVAAVLRGNRLRSDTFTRDVLVLRSAKGMGAIALDLSGFGLFARLGLTGYTAKFVQAWSVPDGTLVSSAQDQILGTGFFDGLFERPRMLINRRSAIRLASASVSQPTLVMSSPPPDPFLSSIHIGPWVIDLSNYRIGIDVDRWGAVTPYRSWMDD
jgi:hypothetical protein